MARTRTFLVAMVSFLSIAIVTDRALGQDDDKWDVEAEHGPSTLIEFETTEGTWINLDVSPDGRWIAFELLGDIFRMPIEGGEAELISGGVSYEQQPRFSPDGATIAFISDRGGADNIWLMNADGSNRRQLTEEEDPLPTAPYWTPDGDYIVAKRHVRDTRSLGGGEIWLYHTRGGSGVELVEKSSFTSEQNEPAVSPDGRWVYYDFTGPFDYNKDVHDGIFQINRFDRLTGEVEAVTRDPGGGVRPTPSPDGRSLAFIRRVRTKSVLFVRDLSTGAERPVFDGLDQDQMETWTVHGAYPAFAWTPDSKSIAITYGGKIWSIDVGGGGQTEIPFRAKVSQRVADALRFEYPIADDSFRSRMIRWTTFTPDGGTLTFQAVGHIWQMSLPDGTPQRITGSATLEYAPSISPDGRWVTFVTWDADAGGHIWRTRLQRPGRTSEPERLTQVPNHYSNPVYSPDGSQIAFVAGSGSANRGRDLGSELYMVIGLIPADGGATSFVTRTANRGSNRRMPRIRWSQDGERLLFQESDDAKTFLASVKLDGTDSRRLVENERAEEIVPSPDGRWVAFKELHNVYVSPLPMAGGDPVKIEAESAGVPVKKLTRFGGNWIDWSRDGRSVSYVLGPTVYRNTLDELFEQRPDEDAEDLADDEGGDDDGEGSPQTNNIFEGEVIDIELTVPKKRPSGVVALAGARIISMRGDEVIEDGTIVVDGPRIRAIGPSNQVTVPDGARIVDVSGKTVIPGLVDVHAHMGYGTLDINPQREWRYYANLAFGVTTTHDPSASTQAVFAQKEMVEAGLMLGPRIYSTGFILYGAENANKAVINSVDDARAHIKRLKAQGAISVKSYNQLRREVRQWIIKAAREENILVVPEGGSMYQLNMTQVLDGHTTIEHAIPVTPLYGDAVNLVGRSNTGYTPTLVVGYGGIWGENYWYQHTNVYENERLLQFVPRTIIDARSRRRRLIPDDEWHHIDISKSANAIAKAGGMILLGAHGQLQGLAAHWEMWMFEQGGMTAHEALRAGTLWGAQVLGLSNDIGSLEAGKLADFVVLNANPLDDLQNSEQVHMTMINGFLYDSDLNEVWPEQKPVPPLRWQR